MIENHLDYITEFILNNKLIKDKTNESNIGYVFFELVGKTIVTGKQIGRASCRERV